MNNKKIRIIGAVLVVAVWLGLTAFAWFSPAKERSQAENRPLATMPPLNAETLFGEDEKGIHFMTAFEDYTLDQFPLRDAWRSVKAMFHGYVLGAQDNNGYYYKDGYLAKQDLTLNTMKNNPDKLAVDQKTEILNAFYQSSLKNSGGKFYVSMVPDKSYYLAEKYGYPSVDYRILENKLRQELAWAQYIDITGTLELSDYYRTDTHWRQEALIPTVQHLSQAMGVTGPQAESFTPVKVDKPFYGVYHGQAALPFVSADDMYIMESPVFAGVSITVDGNKKSAVYDMSLLNSNDQYNIFLSGAKNGLVVMENPNAATDKHLIVFRDSFGSAIAPLFAGDYAKVTLIDLRVISTAMLSRFVDFENADVLVLLSALALNNADEAFMG